jgi:metal-responsive CopG/Arc/MetJ family transcriptional regulator
MKVKTSLTLSQDLVERLDQLAPAYISRSSFIEHILRDYVEGHAQARREAREVAQMNRHAAELNKEMKDVLAFQADIDE